MLRIWEMMMMMMMWEESLSLWQDVLMTILLLLQTPSSLFWEESCRAVWSKSAGTTERRRASGEREMAKEEGTKCQRIGCDALFTPDNNPEGSCHYHSGVWFSTLSVYLCLCLLFLLVIFARLSRVSDLHFRWIVMFQNGTSCDGVLHKLLWLIGFWQ